MAQNINQMNFNFIKSLLFTGVASLAFVSCGGNSEDPITDQTLAQCLTYSTDITSKAQSFNKISFSAQYNYSDGTVDVAIYGMVLPVAGSDKGLALPKMEFKSLPWKMNSTGWKVVDVENVKPVIVGMADAPMFNGFEFCVADIFTGGNYTPGIIYKFGIDSKYKVNGCCMTGTTKSVSPDGVAYIPETDINVSVKPTYWVDLDFENSTANIYLYSAKFLGNMPSLNLEFPDVPFVVKDGNVVLEKANLIPEYNNRPFDAFPISQLKATIDYAKGMTLDFHCGYRGADYTVNVDCKY